MANKEFFIKAVPMVDIDGATNIPTALFYEGKGKYLIGMEARAAAQTAGQRDALNVDFKIDLGNEDPSLPRSHRQFLTATGDTKSPRELTGDFIDQIVRNVRGWLADRSAGDVSAIVVAEPLTMQGESVNSSWLANYRRSLRRILLGKGFSEDNIDFMPEPFAVFQYYKYGVKHPILASQRRHCALVLDFGGGSFDACIIETDKEGEISTKRKNTRPLAALSTPIGGFYLNRKVAESLFFKYIPKEQGAMKTRIRKGLDVYHDWRSKGTDLSTISPDLRNFLRNFHNTIYDVEDPKLTLCKNIDDWSLDATLGGMSVPVHLPKRESYFSDSPEYFTATLTALELRDIVREVWRQRLEPLIRQTLERGKEELKGAPISVVLFSGGSCNIRWLEKLLERDFSADLSDAQKLPLESDFQEVVAKGLAIECARRYYDEEHAGDFSSITYNRLHLVMDPDGKGLQCKIFQPSSGNTIPATNKECVLLPSASVLRDRFEQPLTWRVRVERPPRQFLNYYFLRSGFTPFREDDDVEAASQGYGRFNDDLLNLEENRISSPPNSQFDANLHVQIVISKERKTARPKFIYKMGKSEREMVAVRGKPFYIDMTDTQDNSNAQAYIGLDFGTSNTALSFVSQSAVTTYEARASDRSWLDLGELSGILPYPLAAPLARYLSEVEESRRVSAAREFVEGALGLGAYVAYLELCSYKRKRQTHMLANFAHRSVTPLWRLLRDCLKELGTDSVITQPYKEVLSPTFFAEIDRAITFLGQLSHAKASITEFNPRIVQILATVSQRVFSEHRFGFFENVEPERFRSGEFKGRFRLACGSNPISFLQTYPYRGSVAFPNKTAYILHVETRTALPLQPLIFWYPCQRHPEEEHCYLYDNRPQKLDPSRPFSYKAVWYPCTLQVSQSVEDLASVAAAMTHSCESDSERRLERY
jgi:hypothetical protein